MKKIIFFDLDGTLIDSMPIWTNVARLYVESKGLEYDLSLQKKLREAPLSKSIEILSTHYDNCRDFSDLIDFVDNLLLDHYTNKFPLKENVIEKIREFNKDEYILCITTADPKKYVLPIVERLELKEHIEHIFTPDILDMDKNNKDFYKKALDIVKNENKYLKEGEKNDSDELAVYVFDDSLYALENAKNLNMIPIAVYDKTNEKDSSKMKEISKFYLKDFSDLEVNEL